jgi:hypoxanthine-DNA glycosylase
MAVMAKLIHPWPPVYDSNSRILILGTFPSPKSREFGFYYGHPQNVFWRVLAKVTNEPEPAPDVESRRNFLLENRIAVWDVLHSCEIDGASDASIRNPVPNNFQSLLAQTKIAVIFTTGRKATDLFNKLCREKTGQVAIYLPSTSPANRAVQSKPEFWATWRQIAKPLYDK